jgi:FixJ family two-component response regulator
MHGHTTHVPIVVLTGLDDEAVAVRAMGEGAQDFLVKGHVDGQLLARAIRYAIERQQLATALIQTRQQQLEMKGNCSTHPCMDITIEFFIAFLLLNIELILG